MTPKLVLGEFSVISLDRAYRRQMVDIYKKAEQDIKLRQSGAYRPVSISFVLTIEKSFQRSIEPLGNERAEKLTKLPGITTKFPLIVSLEKNIIILNKSEENCC